jgi:platelet-activating factor acetylhydrolase
MGLTSSTAYPTGTKPSTILPQVGCGKYEVGCSDLMVAGEGDGDTGVFMRIFYPTCLKIDFHTSQTEETNEKPKVEYPLWNERREYFDGLADYRNMSHRKIHFYFDWIIGERRVPAGWHTPLYSKRHPSMFHTSKSTGDMRNDSSSEIPNSKSTHSLKADNEPKFPVIIFSHGLSGSRLIYSTFCSSLASYGFVVAAVEHRDRSSSWTYMLETDPISGKVNEIPIKMLMLGDDEREFKKRNQQNHKRVTECVRALNVLEELNLGQCGPVDKKPKGSKIIVGQNFDWQQFKNRLDISKAAVIGHSMGGATSIAASAFSTDFQCAVVLDGWFYPIEHELYSQTSQPALMLNVHDWQWPENMKRIFKLDKESSEKIMFTFKNVVHQSFSDFTYLMPGYLGRKFGVQGEIDPYEAGEAYLELTVTFLRKCFANEPALEAVREVANRYSNFVMEGTNIKVDDEPVEKEMYKVEEQLDNVNEIGI